MGAVCPLQQSGELLWPLLSRREDGFAEISLQGSQRTHGSTAGQRGSSESAVDQDNDRFDDDSKYHSERRR